MALLAHAYKLKKHRKYFILWDFDMEEGWGGNYGKGSFGPPGDYVDIMIPAGMGKYKMHYYTVIQSIIHVWALNTGTTRNW